mmetsp:Transcript_2019/g.7294  ORF Transcript_2019/g.7294 Transcript_2019/m.7294 type:complete len:211 (-) Transcript_2019:459-1091(-)
MPALCDSHAVEDEDVGKREVRQLQSEVAALAELGQEVGLEEGLVGQGHCFPRLHNGSAVRVRQHRHTREEQERIAQEFLRDELSAPQDSDEAGGVSEEALLLLAARLPEETQGGVVQVVHALGMLRLRGLRTRTLLGGILGYDLQLDTRERLCTAVAATVAVLGDQIRSCGDLQAVQRPAPVRREPEALQQPLYPSLRNEVVNPLAAARS